MIPQNEWPTILMGSHAVFPCAYFGGPWLPMSYINECMHYNLGLKYPLQVLENSERRESIVKILLSLKKIPAQISLFETDERAKLEQGLDNLVEDGKKGVWLYKVWKKKTRNKERVISVPNNHLDSFLREYVKDIIMQAPVHEKCHGGEEGWSVQKSLATHLPIGTVLSFDLHSAFENTDLQYVFDFYYGLMNNIASGEKGESRIDCAGFLTSLSTVYYKDAHTCALPQGSPISNCLFNRVLYPIDELMDRGAKKRNLAYSRWVDDMIISSGSGKIGWNKLIGALRILREDFPVAANKVFVQQGVPEFYLLGHRVIGNMIVPVKSDEAKNRGKLIEPEAYMTQTELEHDIFPYDWIPDEEDNNIIV